MNHRHYLLLTLLISTLFSSTAQAVSVCKTNGSIVYTKACFDEMKTQKPSGSDAIVQHSQPKSKPISAPTPPSRVTAAHAPIGDPKPTVFDEIPVPEKPEPKPQACDFEVLVEQVRSAARESFLACSPSAQQLNQQDERKASRGRSLLHWAITSQRLEMATLLIELGSGLNLQSRADNGAQPIHLAAQRGHLALLKQLLDSGAAVEALDYFKRSPLHWAIAAGQQQTGQQLINAGANPNASDRSGKTPLMLSINQPDSELIRLLFEAGADPARQNFRGMTALHLAATHSIRAVETLLRLGVEIDPRNRDGQTPLLLAAGLNPQRHWDTIKFLLKQGADAGSITGDQQTLLGLSLAHNHLPLFELLLSQGLDSDEIYVGQLKGKTAFIQVLRQQGRI